MELKTTGTKAGVRYESLKAGETFVYPNSEIVCIKYDHNRYLYCRENDWLTSTLGNPKSMVYVVKSVLTISF